MVYQPRCVPGTVYREAYIHLLGYQGRHIGRYNTHQDTPGRLEWAIIPPYPPSGRLEGAYFLPYSHSGRLEWASFLPFFPLWEARMGLFLSSNSETGDRTGMLQYRPTVKRVIWTGGWSTNPTVKRVIGTGGWVSTNSETGSREAREALGNLITRRNEAKEALGSLITRV